MSETVNPIPNAVVATADTKPTGNGSVGGGGGSIEMSSWGPLVSAEVPESTKDLSKSTMSVTAVNENVVVRTPIPRDGDAEVQPRFLTKGYRDVLACIFFGLQLAATIVAGLQNMMHQGENKSKPSSTKTNNATKDAPGVTAEYMIHRMATAALYATGLAVLALALMRTVPKAFIIGINALCWLMLIGVGLFGIASGFGAFQPSNEEQSAGQQQYRVQYEEDNARRKLWALMRGTVLMLFGSVQLVGVCRSGSRLVDFSAMLLKTAATVVTHHYGTLVTTATMLVLLVAYGMVFVLMVMPSVEDLFNGSSDGHDSPSLLIVLVSIPMFYWTSLGLRRGRSMI